ncbi:unnamed protein product [Phaedon cochleariae]|uniref:Endonuclease-reverse transcriptase n=1 Tax=Phaedon cochleariae TaxID=80249 RepID=A0A9N9SLR8_PHACE|nr:unnamed protein product [Phaedon cochleariae]
MENPTSGVASVEAQLHLITTQLAQLSNGINDIRSILLLQNEKLESCIVKVNTLESEQSSIQSKLSEIDKKVNSLDSAELFGELRMRLEREKNIIMYGIEETVDTNEAVTAIINKTVSPALLKINRITRLGQPTRDKVRPVKVEFYNSDDALKVLRKKSKSPLNEYTHLKVKNDYTPRQRNEISLAYKELEQRKNSGEKIVLKFMNGQPQVVSASTKRPRSAESSPIQNIQKINKMDTVHSKNCK